MKNKLSQYIESGYQFEQNMDIDWKLYTNRYKSDEHIFIKEGNIGYGSEIIIPVVCSSFELNEMFESMVVKSSPEQINQPLESSKIINSTYKSSYHYEKPSNLTSNIWIYLNINFILVTVYYIYNELLKQHPSYFDITFCVFLILFSVKLIINSYKNRHS